MPNFRIKIYSLFIFFTISLVTYGQTSKVTGTITDENNVPLPGVNIMIKGANAGTQSDFDGNFSIDANKGQVLIFSFVGTKTIEIVVGENRNYDVVMVSDQASLEEVIIVGYGSQKKENLTGAVGSVSGETLNERPAPNAGNLIQGRVTGLQVTQSSAEPGRDNPEFLIRGRGSFGGSTAPLVLIDGVTGSLNNLSPNDIENITVLKDAASASIYGARAANGVILVTTKSGQKGKTEFSYRMNYAVQTPTALPDLITNSADYMEMYNQAAERSGVAFRYPESDIIAYRNADNDPKYPNFDYLDYYFNSAALINHSLSISGGAEKSSYNISLNYLDQEGMIPGYDFDRYNALLNYNNKISDKIDIGTSIKMTYKNRKEPPFTGANMALSIYAAGPNYSPFLPDGSGRVVSRAYQNEGRNRNPQEYYLMGDKYTKEYNLNAQAFVNVKLLKDLVWSTTFAVNYVDEFFKMHQQNYDAYLFHEFDETGDYRQSTYGPDILGVTDQYAKEISPTVFSTFTYDKSINELHNFKLLAGFEQISYQIRSLRGRRINSVLPSLEELSGYSSERESLFFSHPRLPGLINPSEWAMRSFFGRLNYNFDSKYLFEANFRYDGTSKVSPDNRWGFFPSFSAGWLISKEKFLKDMDWIKTLKIRSSYGTLGNQDIGTYLYQDVLEIDNVNYSFDNETLQQGAVLEVFRDQGIKWESTSVLDVGLDFQSKNNLIGITFDWFRKHTYDILAFQPVPASLGLDEPTLNDGEMLNQGFELELTHRNSIGDFNYNANFLFSRVRNELLEIRVPNYGSRIREEGLPYDSHYLYEWDGIFQIEDINNPDVPFHQLNANPRPGDLKMKDQNGDGVVDAEDRIVVDGAYPDFTYSFGFNANYKNFTFSAFFQGVNGIKTRLENWGVDPYMQGTAPTQEWRNAWTAENPTNDLPALYIAGYPGVASYKASTFYLKDASYLRLKNINIGYDLPSSVLQTLNAKRMNVYFSADNLLTITDFEGGDPERTSLTGNLAQYPQAKVYNFGLNVTF
ncbi:SusC/RagA family TonB-linked outer membrane protein [Zunongwangia endophytica]|uniref:SusC/RagA family TonB-linked outer membrane protein n=1 Tax=Zunongwangia endophytica TaxID=1808945 RepID=A0ABV8H8T4_9FLAO|nr:TonB-dependent receptor [Zunongwangia endophytica]MDN3594867.1 TonB-dependent receptor [Zunongwangia endophytica]